MNSYQSGLFAEWYARMYLRCHGFRIVKSRHITGRNTGRAEIDIIARKRKLILFIEVKHRPTLSSGWDAITPGQVVRLRRAAENYIVKTNWCGDARFDVIIITGWRIQWIQGAI